MTTRITAADLVAIEYKGFRIEPFYDLKQEWCASLFDETGKQLEKGHQAIGDSSVQKSIEYAKELIDIELAKRAIAPRFLALLQQASAEGFTVEQIAYGLLRGSFQFSERGFFLDAEKIELQNWCE